MLSVPGESDVLLSFVSVTGGHASPPPVTAARADRSRHPLSQSLFQYCFSARINHPRTIYKPFSLTAKQSQDAIGGRFSLVPSIRMMQCPSSYLGLWSNLFSRLLSACQFSYRLLLLSLISIYLSPQTMHQV
jgi:hypothetical protein